MTPQATSAAASPTLRRAHHTHTQASIASTNTTANTFIGARRPSWMNAGAATKPTAASGGAGTVQPETILDDQWCPSSVPLRTSRESSTQSARRGTWPPSRDTQNVAAPPRAADLVTATTPQSPDNTLLSPAPTDEASPNAPTRHGSSTPQATPLRDTPPVSLQLAETRKPLTDSAVLTTRLGSHGPVVVPVGGVADLVMPAMPAMPAMLAIPSSAAVSEVPEVFEMLDVLEAPGAAPSSIMSGSMAPPPTTETVDVQEAPAEARRSTTADSTAAPLMTSPGSDTPASRASAGPVLFAGPSYRQITPKLTLLATTAAQSSFYPRLIATNNSTPSMYKFADCTSVIDAQIQALGGRSSLSSGIELPRFFLLSKACRANDGFFLLFHQLFCMCSLDRGSVHRYLQSSQPSIIDRSFHDLQSVLESNELLRPGLCAWFAQFPRPLDDMLREPGPYRQLLPEVSALLRCFSIHWGALMDRVVSRCYPVLMDELVSLLFCLSPILQEILFTASRRRLYVPDGPYSTEIERIFSVDQKQHQPMPGTFIGLPSNRFDQLESLNKELIDKYRQLVSRCSPSVLMLSQLEQSNERQHRRSVSGADVRAQAQAQTQTQQHQAMSPTNPAWLSLDQRAQPSPRLGPSPQVHQLQSPNLPNQAQLAHPRASRSVSSVSPQVPTQRLLSSTASTPRTTLQSTAGFGKTTANSPPLQQLQHEQQHMQQQQQMQQQQMQQQQMQQQKMQQQQMWQQQRQQQQRQQMQQQKNQHQNQLQQPIQQQMLQRHMQRQQMQQEQIQQQMQQQQQMQHQQMQQRLLKQLEQLNRISAVRPLSNQEHAQQKKLGQQLQTLLALQTQDLGQRSRAGGQQTPTQSKQRVITGNAPSNHAEAAALPTQNRHQQPQQRRQQQQLQQQYILQSNSYPVVSNISDSPVLDNEQRQFDRRQPAQESLQRPVASPTQATIPHQDMNATRTFDPHVNYPPSVPPLHSQPGPPQTASPTPGTQPTFMNTAGQGHRRSDISGHVARVRQATAHTSQAAGSQGRTGSRADHRSIYPSAGSMIPIGEFPHDPNDKRALAMSLHQARSMSPVRVTVSRASVRSVRPEMSPSRHYQLVQKMVLGPTPAPARPRLYRFEFTLSEEEIALLAPCIVPHGGLLPIERHFDGSLAVRLRCCKGPRPGVSLTESEWVTLDMLWPVNIYITCNDRAVEVRRKSHNGKDLPADLTTVVRAGVNVLEVFIQAPVPTPTVSKLHVLGVEVIETASRERLVSCIMRDGVQDAGVTRAKIQARLQGGTTAGGSNKNNSNSNGVIDDDDDDFAVAQDDLSVDLADPFSARIFTTPVRGVHCQHIECFDLDNWLDSRPTKPATATLCAHRIACACPKAPGPSLPDKWRCPICSRDARPYSLHVDAFLVDVRRQLEARGQLGTVKSILVAKDGTWRPVAIEDSDPGDDDSDDDSDDDVAAADTLASHRKRANSDLHQAAGPLPKMARVGSGSVATAAAAAGPKPLSRHSSAGRVVEVIELDD